jgi:hypothetical protein
MNDPVNRPSHYTDGKIEVIEYIEDKKLSYCLGNVVKYVSRAGKKDKLKTVEDLRKARWYLDREIQRLEVGSRASAESFLSETIDLSKLTPEGYKAFYHYGSSEIFRELSQIPSTGLKDVKQVGKRIMYRRD